MNYKIIKADIQTAKMSISSTGNPTNDEFMYNIAAYHTQQAVEKCLKYYLHNVYGVDDETRRFRTHNISTLLLDLSVFDTSFVNNYPTIVAYADDLSMWEASSRYGDSLVTTRHAIEKILQEAETIYQEITNREISRKNQHSHPHESEQFNDEIELE